MMFTATACLVTAGQIIDAMMGNDHLGATW